jgi:hypothetical protein
MATGNVPPRLYAILARDKPIAAVFRRGPSNQVLLLTWNTVTHEVRRGQWFKGRIYERRCDLSPSGERLIYFAATNKKPLYSWTAVSRPPYLTALALWKNGSGWGGGGLFTAEDAIELNHGPFASVVEDGFTLPSKFRVRPFGPRPGQGEDDPILCARLTRDGWKHIAAGNTTQHKFGSRLWWEFTEHSVWAKTKGNWQLESRLTGMKERDGPWYVMEHRILDKAGNLAADLGRSDWADWSMSGEILLAREGRLYRIPVNGKAGLADPIEVADLSAMRFEGIEAPAYARTWGTRRKKKLPKSSAPE